MCRGGLPRGITATTIFTAVPPDVPRWLASRDQLLLALGLLAPSPRLFQFALEVRKSSLRGSTRRQTKTSRRLGSYREASHRGTAGATTNGFPLTTASTALARELRRRPVSAVLDSKHHGVRHHRSVNAKPQCSKSHSTSELRSVATGSTYVNIPLLTE